VARPTVAELYRWYASLTGRRTARAIAALIAPSVSPNATSRVLGFGYAAPLLMGLDPTRVERLALAMPGEQGAHRWPGSRPNCALAVSHNNLPFGDSLFDTVVLIHALEFAGRPHRLLRELWRVMAPAGRLVVVVPNRIGIWTHFEDNPFGAGRPYSRGQLAKLLTEAMFDVTAERTALPALPGPWGHAVNLVGGALAPGLGGVRLAVAMKADGARPVMVGKAVPVGAAVRAPEASPEAAN
jgi:SAM-dependent methyltransferase